MSYPGKPPFDLIQLSTLPESEWRGRAVFHPMEQRGDEAIWTITDEDRKDAVAVGEPIPDDEWDTVYEVGVVTQWASDPLFVDIPGSKRVRFVMASGHSLHYAASNLWTPGAMRAQGKKSTAPELDWKGQLRQALTQTLAELTTPPKAWQAWGALDEVLSVFNTGQEELHATMQVEPRSPTSTGCVVCVRVVRRSYISTGYHLERMAIFEDGKACTWFGPPGQPMFHTGPKTLQEALAAALAAVVSDTRNRMTFEMLP